MTEGPRSKLPKPPQDVDVLVGNRIRSLRIATGLSLEKLAEAVGVTFQQLQKYELARNRVSASRLAALAVALGCRVADLLPDLEDRPVPDTPCARFSATAEFPAVARIFDTIASPARRRLLVQVLDNAAKLGLAEAAAEPA